jgi:tRNA (mo5U34)-methyltransferase
MQGNQHPSDPPHRPYTDLNPSPSEELTAAEPAPAVSPRPTTRERATDLAARTDFVWHQRFELTVGVYTPGVSDIGFLMDKAAVPERLDGLSVIDIGTTNGGAAFECERRGASRVVAVDISDENWFGFAAIKDYLGSRVEHLRASVYALPELLDEEFDVVLLWGVLYHLRHPLLALDNVRKLARNLVSVESLVCDHLLPNQRDVPVTRFFRADEFAGDSSNWFAPNVRCLTDWCRSCGLEPMTVRAWPEEAPERAMVAASAVRPEWPALSYEQSLRCSVPPVTVLSTS